MLKKHSQLFESLFLTTDLVVVSAAWLISYWIRFWSGWLPVEKGIPPVSDYVRMLLFVWLIWASVFRNLRLYRPVRGRSHLFEGWQVIRANSLAVVLLLAVTYLFREKSVEFSRLVFVIFWGLSSVLAVFARGGVRLLLRAMRKRGYNRRYALIVGAGDLAEQVVSRIRLHPEYGIQLLGCLTNEYDWRLNADARKSDRENRVKPREAFSGTTANRFENGGRRSAVYRAALSMRMSPVAAAELEEEELEQLRHEETNIEDSLPILGSYTDLMRILAQGGIDQVIVALPYSDHDKLEAVIAALGDMMVDVRIVPDFHRFVQLGSSVEEFDGLPVVSIASTPLTGLNLVWKRAFDIVFGSVFLVLAGPILLLTALLVKCTSKGPVFFSQERVGLDGRTFPIYKFRTMSVDAERGGARFATKGDTRVTIVGRVLRRLNIDELPQLMNVLLGHMSLVGPRPERPVFIREFRRHVPRYMLRHKVQAGMTGWAQVHGWRGDTSIVRRIEHDLFYIENWTLGLDAKILIMTFFKSFRDKNAY